MIDKIVIITGANSGIGKAAAIKFAQEGYTVVMGCRNLEKSQLVQKEIIELTKNSEVHLLQLDTSSFDSIKGFCTTFKAKYNKLDILINNAAYLNHGEKTYQLSGDNIQIGFATNTVGPFLMIQLLIDMLQKSEDGRILNSCTTNIRYFFDPKRKIEFDNLQGEFKDSRPYPTYKMYGDSKIGLLMMTFRMAEKLNEHQISINAIQIPAVKISKVKVKQFKGLWRVAAMVQNMFSISQESMADTYFHICTDQGLKGITGKLIDEKREIVESSHYKNSLVQDLKQFFDKGVYPKYADDIENIDRVWDSCVRFTK